MHRVGLLLLFLASSVAACGYDSCPKTVPNKLNIHIISHSHDDVGWLKTADGYFDEDVKHVLDHVTEELSKNSQRRFVEVEQYFFYRWWKLQTPQIQEKVKGFVKSGQLAFANGGWCVNDEAVTHYSSIIDQMTLGVSFIRETFGDCAIPKLSWQIDPFGASREVANLYSLMEYDGHILNRGNDLFGEFIWNASDSGAKIFTSHLHAHYSAPGGYDFNNDQNAITDANKHEKGNKFVEIAKKWNSDYGNKGHVLIPFGDDFQYNRAQQWFSNIDKLIEVVNKEHSDVHVFYSSPHCYLNAVKAHQVETRTRDYFPLWTGYYSSRPVVKILERIADGFLQAAKQLDVFAHLSDAQDLLFEAKNELGILQHHDAVVGTSQPNVMFDYKERLTNAIDSASRVIRRALGKLITKNYDQARRSELEPEVFVTANISDTGFTHGVSSFAVIIYNPLVHAQGKYIRIPVPSGHGFEVHDFDGKLVASSLVAIGEAVTHLLGHRKEMTHELVFEAQLPALGFTTYMVTPSNNQAQGEKVNADANGNIVLQGQGTTFVFDAKSGGIKQVQREGKTHQVKQEFIYYPSVKSSTYEFCPHSAPVALNQNAQLVSATKFKGFYEVQQKVNDWIHQTVLVYEDRGMAEFNYVIGPIPEESHGGKEIVSRFHTDLKTDKTFYTDANGRQNMKRVYDDRSHSCGDESNTYTFNYYPITSRAIIRDESAGLEFSLHTDRSAGAASMENGQLELMLHRRLFPGNAFIPLNDKDIDGKGVITRGTVLLLLNNLKGESADNYRGVGPHMLMTPPVAFKAFENADKYKSEHIGQKSFLASEVPQNVHLLTVENWGSLSNNEVLLRLENIFQTSDNSARKLNTPSKVSIDKLFTAEANEGIELIHETNLIVGNRKESSADVTLAPQDIKTFVLKVKRSLPPKKDCSLKWAKLENGKPPANALQAGVDAGGRTPLYICRHQETDNLPGKYSKDVACRVSWGGKEVQFNDSNVEILTAANQHDVQWIPRHGGDALPASAYAGGSKKDTGAPIYIGRQNLPNSLQVGKIDEYFYFPYGGRENIAVGNHEVLTC